MSDKLISNYSHLLTQLILLATGGITAEITFLSLSSYQISEKFVVVIVILLALSVISGIVGLITLFGEARDDSPDLNHPLVKFPHLFCLVFFTLGFILFLTQFLFLQPKPEKKDVTQVNVQFKREVFNDMQLERDYSDLNLEQKKKVLKYIQQLQKQKELSKRR